MKKNGLIALLTLGILLLSGFSVGLATQQITIIFDGEKLDCDVAPVMENGRVLVPVRTMAEALGFKVEWSPSARVVHILRNNTIISIGVNGKIAYINDDALEIDIPARIINGRTLVPVRFVSEALGAKVEWQEDKRMVVIKDKQRCYDQVLLYLRQSNLPDARREALLAPVENIFPSERRNFSDMVNTTYYFPEGEAFRFYVQEGDRLSYIEAINNIFTKSWEANLGEQPLEGPESTLSKYFAAHAKGYTEELGLRPLITEPLIFFEFHPEDNLISYGRINPDGTKELLGTADFDSSYRVPVVEIAEEKFSAERFPLSQLPADQTAPFASRIPEVELSKTEQEELEREWADHNYYSYSDIAGLNWGFMDRALREVYIVANWGLPQSSDSEENIRAKKEYEYYLSRFSDEVKSSTGWADFLAMGARNDGDPIFNVLQAQSTENRISATIIGNLFPGFWMLPFLMEIEMEKEGDDWLFTGIDNVKVYETMQEMLKADPEKYYLLVKIYNYRKGKGMQL